MFGDTAPILRDSTAVFNGSSFQGFSCARHFPDTQNLLVRYFI